jgi:hypothetical protein
MIRRTKSVAGMPKENTHLLFAADLMAGPGDKGLQSLLKNNSREYLFGSVFPDTFYYGKRAAVRELSEILHGKDGNRSDEYIFKFLERIMSSGREGELAFLMGYISHCFLDIKFHPVIYYLSGNYYDKDDEKRSGAVYLHRHLETRLDVLLNRRYTLAGELEGFDAGGMSCLTVLLDQRSLSLKGLQEILARQIRLDKVFRNTSLYYLFRLPACVSLFAKANIALFYRNLRHDGRGFPLLIRYRDLLTGAPHETSPDALYRQALEEASAAVSAVYAYYQGRSDIDRLKALIRGESLNTGAPGCPVDRIRFTLGG